MRSALRAISRFFTTSSKGAALHADAPVLDLPDQDEIEESLSPSNGQYANGGYTTIKRSSAGRADWDSWFKHQGIEPVTAADKGGGGGGGWSKQRGNLIINFGGSGEGYRRESGAQLASVGRGLGYGDVGYAIARGRVFRIFPFLGLGGMGGHAEVTDKASLDDARRERETISTGAAEFHIGLGVDVLIPIKSIRLVFGLRLGYRLVSFEFNRDPARSFDPNANGFYSRIISGMERVR
jgi:hypothetical protein